MIIGQSLLRMGYVTGKFSWDSGRQPIALIGDTAGDDVPIWNGTNFVQRQRGVRRVHGLNVSTSDVAYTEITNNLSCVIVREGQLSFEYLLFYTTNDVAEGAGFQLSFSGVASGINYAIDMFTAPATRAPLVQAGAFDSGIAPQSAGPGASMVTARIAGACNVTTPGTLTPQFRAETGGANSVTVYVGSYGVIEALL